MPDTDYKCLTCAQCGRRFALDDDDRTASTGERRSRGGASRAAANNRNVVVFVQMPKAL